MSNVFFVVFLGGFLLSIAISALRIRAMTKLDETDYSTGVTETSRDPIDGE